MIVNPPCPTGRDEPDNRQDGRDNSQREGGEGGERIDGGGGGEGGGEGVGGGGGGGEGELRRGHEQRIGKQNMPIVVESPDHTGFKWRLVPSLKEKGQ